MEGKRRLFIKECRNERVENLLRKEKEKEKSYK